MTHLNSFILGFLILLVSALVSQTNNLAVTQNRDITGEVTLIHENSRKIMKDASKVAVWLVPLDSVRPTRFSIQKPNYRMAQHNKSFEPNLLVVPLGSTVVFPNLDPWFHNVFSLYRGKRFDLGLYEAGSQREVHFDRPGVSYLFCNIHPEMTAVILTVDSEFFGVSDKAGHISIPDVPPGRYHFHVWYENAAPQALQALERVFTIGNDTYALRPISISVSKPNWIKHENKYGRDYDPEAWTADY